jgi:hypothetical protein
MLKLFHYSIHIAKVLKLSILCIYELESKIRSGLYLEFLKSRETIDLRRHFIFYMKMKTGVAIGDH